MQYSWTRLNLKSLEWAGTTLQMGGDIESILPLRWCSCNIVYRCKGFWEDTGTSIAFSSVHPWLTQMPCAQHPTQPPASPMCPAATASKASRNTLMARAAMTLRPAYSNQRAPLPEGSPDSHYWRLDTVENKILNALLYLESCYPHTKNEVHHTRY